MDVGRVSIQEAMREGRTHRPGGKDERGNKGAALTTFISLVGRYLVLMPNNCAAAAFRAGWKAKSATNCVTPWPSACLRYDMVPTAGIGRNLEELQWITTYYISGEPLRALQLAKASS